MGLGLGAALTCWGRGDGAGLLGMIVVCLRAGGRFVCLS